MLLYSSVSGRNAMANWRFPRR